MDKSQNAKSGAGKQLSSQDLAKYQAELTWMHNRTIRELKEAKEKDAREAELRAKQRSQQPRR